MSCLVSFLSSGAAGVGFTGGAWKSSEKRSFSGAGADGADADGGVGEAAGATWVRVGWEVT